MKNRKQRPVSSSSDEAKSKDCPIESREYRLKMYRLVCDLCMGGYIHTSCCNFQELNALVHSLREVLKIKITEHLQEGIHDRHHEWLPDRETEPFHHNSYSVNSQAIKIYRPLIERYGEGLIEKALFPEEVKS